MSSSSLPHHPCAFCEVGSCPPYCSFRSVLTDSPENRKKAQDLLRSYPLKRLENLFTKAGESRIEVAEVVEGLLNEVRERDLYPVTGIQRKVTDAINLLKIVKSKVDDAQRDLFRFRDTGEVDIQRVGRDNAQNNLINTSFKYGDAKNAIRTLKQEFLSSKGYTIESLKEELLKKGFSEDEVADITSEQEVNQGQVKVGEMFNIYQKRAKKPKLDD